MMYRYTVYTNERKIVRGTIESSSVEMAEESLYKAGFQRILDLRKEGSTIDFKRAVFGSGKVSKQALLDFTTELAILTESGLTLLAALRQLEKLSNEGGMRDVVSKLVAELQSGTPFHQALAMHPQVFNETFCSVMEANERAGTLDAGLRQNAKELKQQIAIRSQIQKAATEPAIIIVLAIGVVFLMTLVVLPPLVDIFRKMGAELPLTTRIMIGFSDFADANKWNILVAIPVIAIFGTLFMRQKRTKELLDQYILQAPMLGDIIIWHNTARFTRTMSNLLGAGILLPDAMNVVLRNISNTYLREAMSDVRKNLVQGQSLSSTMSNNKIFPQLLVEMMGVGESSGNLEATLGMVADYFENKVDKRITRMTSLLEPVLILSIGLVVAFVAVSLVSAMYGMTGAFK
jgi:type IV pilus assembly protein PilC